MDYKIIDIFPTAVMKFKIGREFTKNEISFVKQNEDIHFKNAGNTYSKNTFILESNEMYEINEFCKKAITEYFNKIYNPINNVSINITQSWLNYTKQNGFHHSHQHQNSLLSGVFYFSADKQLDTISFEKNDYNQIHIFYKEANDYNSRQVDLKVESGDLIIFPSNISHFVQPTTNKNTRVSLAFNSFITGEVGMVNALNYLKL